MTRLLSRHGFSIALALTLVVLAGVVAAWRMPVGIFPRIDYPRVVVNVDAGDRDPAQMVAEVTRPLEIALRAVPGVQQIRSTTSRGSAQVTLGFDWGEDMIAAKLGVEGALGTVLPDLPTGARFNVRRADPTMFPVLGIALTSKSLDQRALRQLAELTVRPALLAVPGVAGIDILGGSPPEIAVEVDPLRLAPLGLSVGDVADAIAKANVVRGIGRVEDRHRLYLALVDNRPATLGELGAIPVKAADGRIVPLSAVAMLRPSSEPAYVRINAAGGDAVLVNVRQSLTGDTTRIVAAVDARLKAIGMPPSVTVTPFYDQSELVTDAAHAVIEAILIGAVLAGLVLYLFLRSGRLMVITGVMLPAVLAGACLVLVATGASFNMMTLGGMAAAVGLVIDDAVVMLEHVMRRLQEGEKASAQTILASAGEIGRPLIGSTFATIVVFLPLAFIDGVTGGFFKALAITMVAALVLSLLFARFAVPLASAAWLTSADAERAHRADRLLARLLSWQTDATKRILARPGRAVIVTILAFALLGGLAWSRIGSGFMPHMDEGGFILDYKAQSGSAIEDTDRLLRQVEQILAQMPDVESYSRRTGAGLGGGLNEPDQGDYFIRLKNGPRRSTDAVMADLRQRITQAVPGLDVETAQLMEDLVGDLTAVPQPIEVKLFGADPDAIASAARAVAARLRKIDGVVEVVDGLRVAGDSIVVHVDPAAARLQGLDADAVANQLEGLIGGRAATSIRMGDQSVAVRVRAPLDQRARVDQIAGLPLTAPDGHTVRVRQVATVSILPGQRQMKRENLAPFVAVTARLDGRDLGSAMAEVRNVVGAMSLPGVRVDYGGLYAEQQRSQADLTMVFVAALLLVALLLSVLFERPAWTIATIVTVLLSALAVIGGLWACGLELDISAMMGLTMVVGMVTELAIFYLAELPSGSFTTTMLIDASSKRLRPILMSALIAILTLLPLALSLSRGAGLQQPLATAIIFGLIAAVPLVLLFLPAAVVLLTRRPSHS